MKTKLILSLLFFVFFKSDICFSQSYGSQITVNVESIGVTGMTNFSYDIEIFALTVPFEGYTNPDTNFNRYDTIQYGSYQLRRYSLATTDTSAICPITYYKASNLPYTSTGLFAHTSALPGTIEYDPNGTLAIKMLLGFGQYQFTMNVEYDIGPNHFERTYKWVMDYTDSDYGKLNYAGLGGSHYLKRWKFTLDGSTNPPKMKLYNSTASPFVFVEEFTDAQLPTYQIWELATRGTQYHRTTPFAQNFYIRNIAFPLSSNLTIDSLREVTLLTKAIIDTVYPYSYYVGYNTEPSYFSQFQNGKVLTTPGTSVTMQLPDPPETVVDFGVKLTLGAGSNLIVKNGMEFRVVNWDTLNCISNSRMEVRENSKITTGSVDAPGEELEQVPVDINPFGTIILDNSTVSGDNTGKLNITSQGVLIVKGNSKIIRTELVLDTLSETYIEDNAILTIDSSYGKLNLKNGAKIFLGTNAKIIVKNNANFIAQNIRFNSPNNEVWEGLVFQNAGNQTEINNCKFHNAKNPISFYNDSNYVWVTRKITNTTFNLPTGGQKCIYAENVFNLLVQNDSFQTNSGSFGIYVRNNFGPWDPMAAFPIYNLNITGNYFKGGTIGMALMNAELTKFYVYNNRFIGTDNGYYGIITKKMTGSIKENKFSNTNINQCMRFDVSNIDLFNNSVSGNEDNIKVLASTSLFMQPIINNNTFYWKGGINLLTTSAANNIDFSSSNLPLMDWGKNCLTMSGGTGYHLLGTVHPDSTPSSPYNCRSNSWSHIVPNRLSNIQYLGSPIVPVINPVYNCAIPDYDDYATEDMGLDIYDTVWSTAITEEIPEQSADEILYNGALFYQYSSDFVNAVYLNKSLIDTYNESSYLIDAIWNMYACYNELDTADETLHDNLFSELKIYLENMISSGSYIEDVETAAYQAILMCEADLKNFNDAMDGYEFLVEYHPDPVVRINASWDYEDLEELLGEGGSQKNENLTTEEYRIKRLKRLEKSVSGDPLLQKLKDSYDNSLIEKYNKNGKNIYNKKTVSSSDRTNLERKVYNDNQQKIIERSIDNIRFGKNRTKEEKERRLVEDLIISGGMSLTNDNSNGENIIPNDYKLHQNYPNPFNPVTTIKYQIPKDGLVQIKVYDIIGREVMTLVNEQKTAGTYETVFNGVNFASGIYFYRIQAGNFVETKRMMLIK